MRVCLLTKRSPRLFSTRAAAAPRPAAVAAFSFFNEMLHLHVYRCLPRTHRALFRYGSLQFQVGNTLELGTYCLFQLAGAKFARKQHRNLKAFRATLGSSTLPMLLSSFFFFSRVLVLPAGGHQPAEKPLQPEGREEHAWRWCGTRSVLGQC